VSVTAEWIPLDPWADQEVMTEQKLDAQQGNADFNRELLRHRIIASSIGVSAGYYTNAGSVTWGGTSEFRLKFTRTTETTLVTNAITMNFTVPTLHIPSWTRLAIVNAAWTPAPPTGQGTLTVTPQLQQTPGSGWLDGSPVLAKFPLMNATTEADYFCAWAHVFVLANYAGFHTYSQYDVTVVYKDLVVIAGRVDQTFPFDP
jgi:hypothetical protein